MNNIVAYVCYALVAVVLLGVVWSFVRGWIANKSLVATGDKIEAYLDEIAFISAMTPLYLLAKKRGDATILGLLSQCRTQASTWDDVPTTTQATAPNPALADLATRLTAIEAKLTPPAA